MKKNIPATLLLLAILLSAFGTAYYAVWKIQEDDYVIQFDTDKASGKIKGLQGKIVFDEQHIEAAQIDVSVDVNTIATGVWLKNNHAKAEDFFNVEKYPKISFKSKSFKKTASGYLVTGDLQVKNVTKAVQIPFTFQEKGNQGTFEGAFQINRTEYNLIKKGVGEVVKIAIKLPVSK